jgi:hypothetical protein
MNNIEVFNELFEIVTGLPSVIINQELYPQPDWAICQKIRINGLVEDICEHGVGHPNKEWLKIHDPDNNLGIHCCDGCCKVEI